jgi:CHAT domain-containing protein
MGNSMRKRTPKRLLCLITFLAIYCPILSAKTIRVPQEFSTIKRALIAADQGDIIEVDDGIYFEKNIVIDKKVRLRSKNLFGAVIDGGGDIESSIIIIREETEIEGFVLKNAGLGIIQRNSPDIHWDAHHLAIIDIRSAIRINDVAKNIGSAKLYNIIVDNSHCAFSTNDAKRLIVSNCLVSDSKYVFGGANHIEFYANKIQIWNCRTVVLEEFLSPPPPATNKIHLGPDILILNTLFEKGFQSSLQSVIKDIISTREYDPAEESHLENLESVTINILGRVYFRLGKNEKSIELYKRASSIGEKIGSSEIVWNAYYGLANSYKREGKAHEAIRFYKKSIEMIESARSEFSLMEQKSAFMVSRIKVYESFVNLLFELHRKHPSANYHEEAFYYAEKSKARAFLDGLHETDIDFEANLDSEIKKEMQDLRNKMARLHVSLKQPQISLEERDYLLNELEKSEDSYTSLMVRIKSKNQDFVNLVNPYIYTYEQIKDKLLNEDTVLLEYYIGENISLAFLATATNLYVARVPGKIILSNLVEKYLNFLTLKDSKEFKGMRGGKRLYQLLLSPFENIIKQGVKRIIIVPDGNLNYLPFESLIWKTQDGTKNNSKNHRFFVEDLKISYAPSASSLIHLMEREVCQQRSMDLLAVTISDPVFDFSPLRYSVKEVRAISKLFNKDKRTLLLNDQATESDLKKYNLNDYKIIHFAVHGIVDDKKWYRSALILWPEKNIVEDGFLQPKDLFNIKLNSDLVVLSACQTRHGKLEKGEGILGLARSFCFSGSKSILSSLWKIDDKQTAQFMKYFYGFLLEGKPKDSALRLAKIEMLKSKYNHPYFWAAFVLIGDFSPLEIDKKH